ncbi:signal peptidase I [Ornithinibacillus halotolerans]|uniref:Signal peptidase I n=1 Tax=Ornithinibacillus halotolerans TaxID=1274357 RepID=A0A916W952_9BACI|nr:signal peptidase I [Ornithinibacillus halotolerans]
MDAQAIDLVTKNKEKETEKTSWVSWGLYIVIIAAVFLIFRYVIGITIISGNSMANTMEHNDVILSSNLFYQPERNDIIIFRDEHGFDVIKRIIALPNETVEITNGVVLVNGKAIEEEYSIGVPNDMEKVVVSENSYFVMGDNRTPGESLDSRSEEIGTIPENRIQGEAILSLWPFHILK